MTDAHDSQPPDMTDAELDTWLRDANADICAALADVVDTEAALAQVKERATPDTYPKEDQ